MSSFRVSAVSRPQAVAGALVAMVRSGGLTDLEAVGAGAVNQTVKAIAIARGLLGAESLDLVAQPAFFDVDMQGVHRTGIRFRVCSVPSSPSPTLGK